MRKHEARAEMPRETAASNEPLSLKIAAVIAL
jgi:hypothetical protein